MRVQYDPVDARPKGGAASIDDLHVDNVVSVHLERMGNGDYWLGLNRADGSVTHIDIFSPRKLWAVLREDAP